MEGNEVVIFTNNPREREREREEETERYPSENIILL
jgi:hypothetical protein